MEHGRQPVAHEHEDDDAEGCSLDFREDTTPDWDLPAAAGGVELAQNDTSHDDTDGCELDFGNSDSTTDEELPVAIGGVA
jgi:hypothetical protein